MAVATRRASLPRVGGSAWYLLLGTPYVDPSNYGICVQDPARTNKHKQMSRNKQMNTNGLGLEVRCPNCLRPRE